MLLWVQPADEAEVGEAFKQALKVRTLGPEARDLADRYFFETIVACIAPVKALSYVERLYEAGSATPGHDEETGATAERVAY